MSAEPDSAGLLHQLRHQVPLMVWLVLVWILLWGTWSWANLIAGTLLALVVTVLLPLPPVIGGARRLGEKADQRLRRHRAYEGTQAPAPARGAIGERDRQVSGAAS